MLTGVVFSRGGWKVPVAHAWPTGCRWNYFHDTAQYCTILHCTTPYCTILNDTTHGWPTGCRDTTLNLVAPSKSRLLLKSTLPTCSIFLDFEGSQGSQGLRAQRKACIQEGLLYTLSKSRTVSKCEWGVFVPTLQRFMMVNPNVLLRIHNTLLFS